MGARGAGGPRYVRSGRARPIGGLKGEFRRAPGLAGGGPRGVRCRSVLTDRPFVLPILRMPFDPALAEIRVTELLGGSV